MDSSTEKYSRARGIILKLLAISDPVPVESGVMYKLLDHLGFSMTKAEFGSHLRYLAHDEKGYIEMEKPAGNLPITNISIKPHGLDLLDKFTKTADPGVNVDFDA